jgi:hypothetical protein
MACCLTQRFQSLSWNSCLVCLLPSASDFSCVFYYVLFRLFPKLEFILFASYFFWYCVLFSLRVLTLRSLRARYLRILLGESEHAGGVHQSIRGHVDSHQALRGSRGGRVCWSWFLEFRLHGGLNSSLAMRILHEWLKNRFYSGTLQLVTWYRPV